MHWAAAKLPDPVVQKRIRCCETGPSMELDGVRKGSANALVLRFRRWVACFSGAALGPQSPHEAWQHHGRPVAVDDAVVVDAGLIEASEP